MNDITIACLDMAGTTVQDEGDVTAAFSAAFRRFGAPPGTPAHDAAMQTVHATMGQSKIDVFRLILRDEATAQRANEAFEERYAAAVEAGGVTALPGALHTITRFGGVPLAFLFIATLGSAGTVTGWLTRIGFDPYAHGFNLYTFSGIVIVYMYFQIPLMVPVILPAMGGLRPAWRDARVSRLEAGHDPQRRGLPAA